MGLIDFETAAGQIRTRQVRSSQRPVFWQSSNEQTAAAVLERDYPKAITWQARQFAKLQTWGITDAVERVLESGLLPTLDENGNFNLDLNHASLAPKIAQFGRFTIGIIQSPQPLAIGAYDTDLHILIYRNLFENDKPLSRATMIFSQADFLTISGTQEITYYHQVSPSANTVEIGQALKEAFDQPQTTHPLGVRGQLVLVRSV